VSNLITIEKQKPFVLAELFEFLKSKREDYGYLVIQQLPYLFCPASEPLVTENTPCYLDDCVERNEAGELIAPEFCAQSGWRFFYSSWRLVAVFEVLQGHVENPSMSQFLDSLQYYDKYDSFLAIDMPFAAFTVVEEGGIPLDLTGKGSHIWKAKAGVGSLRIAPKSSRLKADCWVEADESIHWPVFSSLVNYVGYFMPRAFSYAGNDSGFFSWSRSRPIEEMIWTPLLEKDTTIDIGCCKIRQLTLNIKSTRHHLCFNFSMATEELSGSLQSLCLQGDLSQLSFIGNIPSGLRLILYPATTRHRYIYRLPDLSVLHQVTYLEIRHTPTASPISLSFLVHFTQLQDLYIEGYYCDFESLSLLKQLKSLTVRDAPNLTGFPELTQFEQLQKFTASNIEETMGRRLRTEFKVLAKLRPWCEYSGVSGLRNAQWWEKEYGNPFREWRGKLKKLGQTAFAEAKTALQQAASVEEAQRAFTQFSETFNNRNNAIETMEREDIGEALFKLAQLPRMAELGIDEELALAWFEEVRDY